MSSRLALIVYLFASSLAGAQESDPFAAYVRPTEPLSPAAEQASFTLPDGFEIQLVAAEPDIQKPLNMALDERGRLWITDTVEYPYPAPPGRKGRDTIKVLEDTDGDGRADKITVFADGLNVPIGLYPAGDAVIAFSIPHIWRLEDTDGDGRADKREKLYGPFGYERDTHGLNNAFRRGFDGWLYACHGFNNQTKVQGRDGHVVEMQSGNTYRMRLDGSRIEQFTRGQVNPFGMTFDPLGNIFTADCHTKPIYQLLRGGYYPSFGKPHDGLGFAPEMMSHLHGSTAIGGIAFYTGTNFPPRYRPAIFTGNVMTSRVNQNSLEYHGSTIIAREQPDFVKSADPWFRPVDLQVGPDGALYVADFYNRIIGHYEVPLDHPGRDRRRGRIWRITYRGHESDSDPASMPPDLSRAPVEQLVAALGHPSLSYRLAATNLLVDQFGSSAADRVSDAFYSSADAHVRAHALWVMFRLDVLQEPHLKQAMADPHRIVRVHAMKILAEKTQWFETERGLAASGLGDADAFVQRAAADALGRHPRGDQIQPLLDRLVQVPSEDTHLRHTVRMALRDHLKRSDGLSLLRGTKLDEQKAREVASIALAIASPQSGAFLLEHMARFQLPDQELLDDTRHAAEHVAPGTIAELVELVRRRSAGNTNLQLQLIDSVRLGLQSRGVAPHDTVRHWGEQLAGELLSRKEHQQLAAKLVADLELRGFKSQLTELVTDPSATAAAQAAAAESIVALEPEPRLAALAPLIAELSLEEKLRRRIGRLVVDRLTPSIDAVLVDVMMAAPARVQLKVAEALAGDSQGAICLLELVENGHASARLLLRPGVKQKLANIHRDEIHSRLAQLTTGLPQVDYQLETRIRQRIEGYTKSQHSADRGEKLFEKHCMACHQIGGKGEVVGPQLDGVGNRGLERLVEDILDPNRNVDVAFRSTTLVLTSGKVVTGLFRREEGADLVLADGNGKEFRISRSEIDERVTSDVSIMPTDFEQTLPEQAMYDLLSHLLQVINESAK